MSKTITLKNIVDNWTDEPYMNILMCQCEELRCIVERLDDLNEKDKLISQTYVIGLLRPKLNNALLEKYSVDEYLAGISNLCQYYDTYIETDKNDIIIKKSWMSVKNREKFFIDLQFLSLYIN